MKRILNSDNFYFKSLKRFNFPQTCCSESVVCYLKKQFSSHAIPNEHTNQNIESDNSVKHTLIKLIDEQQNILDPIFNKLIKEKFFFVNSSLIYGGLKGVYDYGPCGCNMKNNINNLWRKIFINNEDNMTEVDCSILTTKRILEASGHLSNFNDFPVMDTKSKSIYRCDHVIKKFLNNLKAKKNSESEIEKIENILNKLNEMNIEEMQNIINDYKITGPDSGTLSSPGKINLLYSTNSEFHQPLFLRPETAQGIFVNFLHLSKFHQGNLPFGVGQIGTAFRNEINPEQKLIRNREFQMAEIEYFFNPKFTGHERFYEVADLKLNIWSAEHQINGLATTNMSLEQLVNEKLILENHAYFLGRIYEFLREVGIDLDKIRFRQHLPNEVAHYSKDCWDAECLTTQGWVECVGCANRGNYDLLKHNKESGIDLRINQYLDEPKSVPYIVYQTDRKAISEVYGDEIKIILEHLKSLSQTEIADIMYNIKYNGEAVLLINDKRYMITKEMMTFEEKVKYVAIESISPHVIEPSFGIGRILQCILEHNLCIRSNNSRRIVLNLPNTIAPYKVMVLPLMKKQIYDSSVKRVIETLKKSDISHLVDQSNESIGRRYCRADQIGIPFVVTIDNQSIEHNSQLTTIRERNSMRQIHVKVSDLSKVLISLISNELDWHSAAQQYPLQSEKSDQI